MKVPNAGEQPAVELVASRLAAPGYNRVTETEVVLKHRCCLVALTLGPDGALFYTTPREVYRVAALPDRVGNPTPLVREPRGQPT